MEKEDYKYKFQDNFNGDWFRFVSLIEAKKAAKKHTYGFPIYIYDRGEIAAIVNPNDKPIP